MSNGNVKTIYNFFKQKGLNDNQIFGILGNAQQESNFNPTAVNSSSGAYGVFQWLGSRKENLIKYASARGKHHGSLDVQLDFAWEELNSTERGTLNALNANKNASASQLAEIFENKFERSGGSAMENRKKYASEWAVYFGSNASTDDNNNLVSGNSGGITTGNSTPLPEIETDVAPDLSVTGTIIKALSILLVGVLCVVFLILTLKGSVTKGISGMLKDVIKDIGGGKNGDS